MGLIEKVSRAIAADDTLMTPLSVEDQARHILTAESPWLVEDLTRPVVDAVLGFGPLQRLLEDRDVSDILANGPGEVWVDRGDGLQRTSVSFSGTDEMVATIERAIAPSGLRIDRSAPMVDARLSDGSRLHAVLPPASVDVPLLAIRRFTQRVETLDGLVEAGAANRADVEKLTESVARRESIVVSGGTGVGKTTLLNLLAGVIPTRERVVTVEDAAELALPGHVVRLEARPPNGEGTGEITIRSLLRSALRLRPDRIILGEVRGPEALDLVSALNTGHRGSMTTVHANSPREAIWRLETLALSAGDTSERAVCRQLRAAIDVVVQLERVDGVRRIAEIARVADDLEETM